MDHKKSINKCASIIYRNSQILFDRELQEYGMGSGQQFFLMRIDEYPGISAYEIAKMGHYDKGTSARAIGRLEELNYIIRVVDTQDKRSTRLYLTDIGKEVVKHTWKVIEHWNDILCEGLSEAESEQVGFILDRIANNAYHYNAERKKEQCRKQK